MRNIFSAISLSLIIIMVVSSLSFGQEGRRGMDPAKVKALEKASEEVLEDAKELAKKVEKLTAFRQANEKAYGFPSDLQELQKMQEAAESLADNELEEIVEFYESLQDKYEATGANDLNVAMGKVINPFPERAKKTFPWSANTLEMNMAWFKEFRPTLEKKLEEAEEQAEKLAEELNKPKELTEFPDDSYSGGDLSDIKKQMLKAFEGSKTEITGLVVTSDWDEGFYRDSKQPYRKINGTVLYADTDGDDVSRYLTHVFISNEINGEWQPLKYKAICLGCPEGWTEAGSGSMASGGDGFLGTLLWFILALANILGGLIAAKVMLNKYHPLIEKMASFLAPYSIHIGLVALGAGILSFVISLLGLRPLYAIVPQATAVLLGIILAYDYIKMNAKGKIKDQMDSSEAAITQVNAYSQTIGLAGLVVGLLYLIFNGSFYFI